MIAIAHLSDIHITDVTNPVLGRSVAIGNAIGSELGSSRHVVIAISGDIAYSGTSEQYDLALQFFQEIRETLEASFEAQVDFVACPGNHDCDFSADQEFRDLALTKVQSESKPSIRVIEECTSIQSAFFKFLSDLCNKDVSVENRLRYQIPIKIDNEQVVFDCLNLAWVSRLHEGRIPYPVSIVPDSKEVEGLLIGLMHHPFNWLHPQAYRDFRKRMRAGADIVLSGHEHEWAAVESMDSDSGGCLHLEGALLQDLKLPEYSSFAVYSIDSAEKKYRAQRFELQGEMYVPAGMGAWSDYRPLHIAAPDGFWRFTAEFDERRSDAGISLQSSTGRTLRIDDIFIFPDIDEVSSDDKQRQELSSISHLLDHAGCAKGFVLQGEERSGRTSLLRQIAAGYLSKGLVPVFLSGQDLTSATEQEVRKHIISAARYQLAGGTPDEYLQLPLSRRVILVDDIDEVPIKSEKAASQLIDRLRAYAGVLVLTCSDVYEAAQVVEGVGSDTFSSLPKFRLQPFGHVARLRLIKKWIFLNSDDAQSEEQRIARIDEAERYTSGVLNRGVVPSYPLYLVTLLHASRRSDKESLQDGGFGHYYEYLISQGFLAARIPKSKLDEFYSYCTQLGWFICSTGSSSITEAEFRKFNRQFSSDWIPVDFARRKEELLKSGLLIEIGDAVAFKYPYLQYYFVARYLSENLEDPEAWNYIRESVQHLYVRSRANALVFLTHFTGRTEVINVLLDSIRSQFVGPVVQFNNTGESVERLMHELPKLAYNGKNALVNREDAAKEKDRRNRGDGLSEVAETGGELSFPSRLTCMFKTVEIMGQVLRSRYASLRKPVRQQMLKELMSAPLRTLETFYDLLRDNPSAVIAEFKAVLRERDKNLDEESMEKLAARVASFTVLAVSFDFVRKAADAATAEVLKEDLSVVVEENGELALRVVGLAAVLDGQRDLPRLEIERVLAEGAGSLIVENLVRLLVLNRMHMFKTTASDIQWARDHLHIPTNVRMKALIAAFS